MTDLRISRRSLIASASATALATAVAANTPAASPALLAENAALWGFPLVLTGRYLKLAQEQGAQYNQFYLNPTLATPSLKVAGPNVDTIYGYAWVDVSEEPVVLSVPDAGDRYYSIQLLDAYENSFAYVGTRETGSRAGNYAITAPGWRGKLPAGVTQIAAPTTLLFLLTRTLVRSNADAAAAEALQNQYKLGTLSAYPAGQKVGIVQRDALNILPILDLTGAGPEYFTELDALLKRYPPTGAEALAAKPYAALGLGVDFAAKSPPASVLQEAVTSALKKIKQPGLFSEKSGAWTTNYRIEKFIKDPLARAITNSYGPGGHIREEALYFNATADAAGAPLTGARNYELIFPKGQLPPVDASGFWSLTLYGQDFFLVDNPINRYAIHDRTAGLKYGADGSLRIQIQRNAPADQANWLPAPDGPFRLIVRTYIPKKPILDKTYILPPVTAV